MSSSDRSKGKSGYDDDFDDSVVGGYDDDDEHDEDDEEDENEIEGSKGNDSLVGTAGADSIDGEKGDDTLDGGAGNDTLDGGKGDDLIYGGDGADLFVVRSDRGADQIADFTSGEDVIRVHASSHSSGISDFASLLENTADDADGNAVIDLGGGSSITLVGVRSTELSETDFLFT